MRQIEKKVHSVIPKIAYIAALFERPSRCGCTARRSRWSRGLTKGVGSRQDLRNKTICVYRFLSTWNRGFGGGEDGSSSLLKSGDCNRTPAIVRLGDIDTDLWTDSVRALSCLSIFSRRSESEWMTPPTSFREEEEEEVGGCGWVG